MPNFAGKQALRDQRQGVRAPHDGKIPAQLSITGQHAAESQ